MILFSSVPLPVVFCCLLEIGYWKLVSLEVGSDSGELSFVLVKPRV